MNTYGLLLDNGNGAGMNKQEAIRYYKMAIKKGNANAMSNYAVLINNGDVVAMNKQEAIRYYKMAIKKGAMYNLGILLYERSNKLEAAYYFKMAADKGRENALKLYNNMKRDGMI